MAQESRAASPIPEVSLPELARQLVTALQEPGNVSIGAFAAIVERLHGELTMLKDHEALIAPAPDTIECDTPEATEPGSMPGQVGIFSAELAPE